MSKERISIVKKAVQKSAEELAKKEFLDKPEQRHLDKSINLYKDLRESSPEFFKDAILLMARRKELKNEMGAELYNIFDDVWAEILNGSNGYENRMREALKQVRNTRKLSLEEYKQEKLNLTERFLQEKGNQIKNDYRIVSAFIGKGEILDNAIEFEKSYLRDLLESFLKHLS